GDCQPASTPSRARSPTRPELVQSASNGGGLLPTALAFRSLPTTGSADPLPAILPAVGVPGGYAGKQRICQRHSLPRDEPLGLAERHLEPRQEIVVGAAPQGVEYRRAPSACPITEQAVALAISVEDQPLLVRSARDQRTASGPRRYKAG